MLECGWILKSLKRSLIRQLYDCLYEQPKQVYRNRNYTDVWPVLRRKNEKVTAYWEQGSPLCIMKIFWVMAMEYFKYTKM